jgi:putative addiction module killer protein
MLTLEQTEAFAAWLSTIRDQVVKGQIAGRIRRAQGGNFGGVAPVGDGISEMRLHFGAGYRIYLARRGDVVYLLLNGGTKRTSRTTLREQRRFGQKSNGVLEDG